MPETRLVTVYWPLTTTGAGATAIHAVGEIRFVVACRANPVTLVGHFKTTFVPEAAILNCGGLLVSEMLNKVPPPQLPPFCDVPYKMSPDKTRPFGPTPSKLAGGEPDVAVKLCRVTKLVPSVFTLNTVPLPQVPPPIAVPKRTLLERIRFARGPIPS